MMKNNFSNASNSMIVPIGQKRILKKKIVLIATVIFLFK